MTRPSLRAWLSFLALSAVSCRATVGLPITPPAGGDPYASTADGGGDRNTVTDPGPGGDPVVAGDAGGDADLPVEECQIVTVRCVDDQAGPTQEYATLQAAVDASGAGDTVLVFPGNYDGFRIDHSGTPSQPITIRAAGAGVNLTGIEAQSHNSVRFQNASYVVLDGFRIVRPGTVAPYDYEYACIAARGTTPDAPMHGLVIRNTEVAGCSPAGLYLSETEGLLLERNYIHDNVHDSDVDMPNGQGIYLANAGTKNVVVRDNRFIDNEGPGIHFNGDSSVGGDGVQSGHLFERNLVIGNGQNGFNMDGVQSSTFINNVFAANVKSGLRDYAIDAAAGPLDLVVVNNTFYGNGMAGVRLSEDSGGHVLFNNLFVANGEGAIDIAETTPLVSNNIDLTSGASLFLDAAGRDYRLANGSAAVNAGVLSFASHSAPTNDCNRCARTDLPDVGAYELGSTP